MSDTKDTNPKDISAVTVGKVPLGLFPDTARVAGAMAMLEGACKYGAYNYRIMGIRTSVYLDAIDRHLVSFRNGEVIDPDSGLPHLWKALASIAVLIDATETGLVTDDRPPSAPIQTMLAERQGDVVRIRSKHSDKDPHHYTIHDIPAKA